MANDYIDQWNANGVPYAIHDKGRAQPNGVATLDSDGRIPYSQLPESAVELKGYWNANTNTPTLVDGTGTTGDEYYVDVAGSQNLGSGTQYFNVGDRVLYIDGVWKNINSTSVKSVNGVLPNAQGDVNILNKVYPIGSIYQNISDATNPGTLFGVGHWTQITDKFLAAKGLEYATTGGGTYTLTENNIPRHTHGSGAGGFNTGASNANVSVDGATAVITSAKNPHTHGLFIYTQGSGHSDYYTFTPSEFGGLNQYAQTSVSSNDNVTITQDNHYHGITQTAHTHTLDAYGKENPDAITIVPKYQAVYTWYRDS